MKDPSVVGKGLYIAARARLKKGRFQGKVNREWVLDIKVGRAEIRICI